jgi:hypothetical protein
LNSHPLLVYHTAWTNCRLWYVFPN